MRIDGNDMQKEDNIRIGAKERGNPTIKERCSVCTAITYQGNDFYFGRNLDLEYHYRESVAVTPRNYPFVFRNGQVLNDHYALIGMAMVSDGYPLYYEATNEKGLSLAGLNFPGNACYYPPMQGKDNIAPFELIPWLLGRCATVAEALEALSALNLWDTPFSEQLPLSPLHWLLADATRSVTLEPLRDGLKIYENPVGVLTNNPPFDYHLTNLNNYLNLTAARPTNRFSEAIDLQPYCLGMGALGLPGDPSSASRFVRAAFTKLNSRETGEEAAHVSQFFHLLKSVEQQKGISCVRAEEYEYTVYSSCCNTTTGIYYYTTYENPGITAVDMHRENLDGTAVVSYPLKTQLQLSFEN